MGGPVAIVEGQGSREGRGWDADLDGGGDHVSPSDLTIVDSVTEELVQEQIGQLRILGEGILDLAQEGRPEK